MKQITKPQFAQQLETAMINKNTTEPHKKSPQNSWTIHFIQARELEAL